MCHLNIPEPSHSNLSPSANTSPSLIPAMLIKVTETAEAKKSDIFSSFFSALMMNHIFLPTPIWEGGERRARPWEGRRSRAQNGRGHCLAHGARQKRTSAAPRHMPGSQRTKTKKTPQTDTTISNPGTGSCVVFDKISLISLPSVLFNKIP